MTEQSSQGDGHGTAVLEAGAPLQLCAVLDISEAEGLRQKLTQLSNEPGCIRIDGSMVERVDTAAIQVLAVFWRDVSAIGRPPEWSGASDALKKSAKIVGLERLLRLES